MPINKTRQAIQPQDIQSIEIKPIDTRFTINLSTQTPPTKHTELQHRQALQQKQDSKAKDSSLTASNDKSQSTSMLHPILEDNEIKCPHNGVVKLKANKGKPFSSKGIPMVLESDLLNASIIGCANNILALDSKTFSTNQYIIPKNKAINAS